MDDKKLSFDFAGHILIIDDDAGIRELLGKFLMKEGYLVNLAESAMQAEVLLSGIKFDLIVTDKMMPQKDGIQFLMDIRSHGDETPVVMLTAVDNMETKLEGLSIGADDYIAKPFEPKELLLRIANILKRTAVAKRDNGEIVVFGEYSFNKKNQELRHNKEIVKLTNVQKKVMNHFVTNANKVVSRAELCEVVGSGDERSVDVLVARLRKIIVNNGSFEYIVTVRNIGYKFVI